MQAVVFEHLRLVLFCAIAFSRLCDIGTTYLVTPTLKLEANPVVRKLGWPFAWATLLIAFVAYLDEGMGITILTISLLVSASNASRLWTARAMGEEAFLKSSIRAAAAARPLPSLALMMIRPCLYALIGLTMMFFYSQPDTWGYWFGYGFLAFAAVIIVYEPLAFFRLRRSAAAAGTAEASSYRAAANSL